MKGSEKNMGVEISHKGAKVYIYTRVSTEMQVDGYSLDAQKEEILKEVNRHDMIVAGEYTDEGRSGKSIIGRNGFQEMLDDIVARKDGVSFVLVYKLSRFGRNVADILSTLKTMRFYGVHLICVADNIDSSLESGRLIISILGAVAEIERDNILAQTLAGRKEKARQGLFNGGVTPYGYKLDKETGKLVLVEEEAKIVRIIFEKYNTTSMGFAGIAKWLKEQGYEKGARTKNGYCFFTEVNIRRIIDNPVYTGMLVYGRTVTKAKDDNPEAMHRVKSDDYIMTEVKDMKIIEKETFETAKRKREETGGRKLKIEKDHEYILSGLVKCPECGKSLYGVPMRGRKRKDGSLYPTYYSYMCRPSVTAKMNGHKCNFGQVGCNPIDKQVRDIIAKLVNEETFRLIIQEQVGESIDIKEIKKALDQAYKDVRQAQGRQKRLEIEQDNLDVTSKHYDRMFESINRRLEKTFEELDNAEKRVADAEARLESVKKQSLTKESIIKILKLFDELYDSMTDYEKKNFMQSFIESIDLFPKNGSKRGTSIKTIHFRFPVSYNGESVYEVSLRKDSTVETIVLMSRRDK